MPVVDPISYRRRYVLISALTWLPVGLVVPIMVLQMTERGLDIAAVGLIFALHGIAVTSLELPTGGLADVIGRRGVLAASAAIGVAALLWLSIASSMWEFVLITVLRATARALASGPAEAWYVDSVQAVDKDADIRTGLAHGQSATSVALVLGTIVGGGLAAVVPLPDDGFITPLSVPTLLAAVLYVVLLLVALFGMPEPAAPADKPGFLRLFREVPRTIGTGLRLGFTTKLLAYLLLTVAVGGIALDSVELLVPGRMEGLTGDAGSGASAYAVVSMIGFAGSALGAVMSTRVSRLVGGSSRGTAVIGTLVSAAGLVSLCFTAPIAGVAGIAVTGAGYLFMYLGLGLIGPGRSELMHRQVTASERATIVSVSSLAMQVGGMFSALGLPWLVAATSSPVAWLVSGLLLAASAVLFRAPGGRKANAAAKELAAAGERA